MSGRLEHVEAAKDALKVSKALGDVTRQRLWTAAGLHCGRHAPPGHRDSGYSECAAFSAATARSSWAPSSLNDLLLIRLMTDFSSGLRFEVASCTAWV